MLVGRVAGETRFFDRTVAPCEAAAMAARLDPDLLATPLAEALLRVLDRKTHWAWHYLTEPGLSRGQLLAHFRHEYLVYVRDFPVLLGTSLGRTPPILEVRKSLAENLYEEQTGGLSGSGPHPELFLILMDALGFERSFFADDDGSLTTAARSYRDWIGATVREAPWQVGAALLTIFVEGSRNDRGELLGTFKRPKGESAVLAHPLVRFYGVAADRMALTKAHAAVEGSHRTDAWHMVLTHTPHSSEIAIILVKTMEEALTRWLAYRDSVADAMSLERPPIAPE